MVALLLRASRPAASEEFVSGDDARPRKTAVSADETGRLDQGGESAARPGPLDPLFRAIDPARVERRFDQWLGLGTGGLSDRPRPPEIPEPVFFDVVRPLGDLKYANELNYLITSGTRNAPTLQVIEYEYVFADWGSAELDLSYYNENLQILTPFYQRTLGVGPQGNWVHGYQLSADLYLRSGFVGGSPVYNFSWKPERESRFSTSIFIGANRALIGGFTPARAGPAAFPGGPGSVDRPFGAWRPTLNVDFFYKLGERWTIGVENDLFFHPGKAGEYLSFPFLTYEAGKHAFIQVGAGYYHFESRDQLTFLAHINLVNPSTRRTRAQPGEPGESVPEGRTVSGDLGGWFGRLVGSR